MNDKVFLFVCGAAITALLFIGYDSAAKIAELRSRCEAKHGIIVTKNRQIMCVRADAIIP